jgi:hypothetical protein
MRKLKIPVAVALTALIIIPFFGASAAENNRNRNRRVLTNAIVTNIAGYTITATKNNLTYTIDATNAKLHRRYNARAAFSEIIIGDTINVWGTIDGTNITARKVQDLSIQMWKATFNGSITAIDSANNNFTLQTNSRGTQTVNVYDYTKFKYKKRTAKTFADLQVGDRVVAKGIWNRAHNLVYNTTWVNIKAYSATN